MFGRGLSRAELEPHARIAAGGIRRARRRR